MANSRRVRFLRHVVHAGRNYRPGDITELELSASDARRLIDRGHVEYTTARPTPKAVQEEELRDPDEGGEEEEG